ncbi:hypothetical protein C7S18_00590 [Ahniella affigens]|uniref:Uncharacterized protein n=1 Tax=Ahniella affigens TaxID=2021234 RepID=A0A2P1PLR1_9GAMM|nr:tetratricopeptide repeat protein [Ahniella affigens]AVP95784.1 hypothetical protein C7S18_00590 [Ahniella affigens]
MSLSASIQTIQQLLAQQQIDPALSKAEALARVHGNDATVLALYGHLLRRSGQLGKAIDVLKRSTRLNARIPNVWLDLARAHFSEQQPARALEAAQQLLTLLPGQAQALGIAFDAAEALAQTNLAEHYFERLLAADSRNIDKRLALGNQAFDQSQWLQAARHYRVVLQHAPSRVEASLNLAACQAQTGDLQGAVQIIEQALGHAPTDARLLLRRCRLGDSLQEAPPVRIDYARRWLLAEPTNAQARLMLAYALLDDHQYPLARQELDQLTTDPASRWPAAWVRWHYPRQAIHRSAEARTAYRAEIVDGINAMHAALDRDEIEPALAERILATCPNFFIGYLNEPSPELARQYAGVLRRLAVLAGLADQLAPPPARAQTRVAVVSAHIQQHSVSRVWRDLICGLPAEQFELGVFQLNLIEDASTAIWQQRASHYQRGNEPPRFWREQLAAYAPDVILYLDIGMEPTTQTLACLRLAPIQMTTWGHPVSSGHATIDYFLSSDLAEPVDAAQHYSERLVRIAGLAAAYQFIAPTATPIPERSRLLRLICMQNAWKLNPEQIPAFRAVLDALPEAELVFASSMRGAALGEFEAALHEWFGAERMRRVRVLGFLSYSEYCAWLESSDLALDAWGWSGGITSFDAAALGLPIVTLPGVLMRGRQTLAILNRLAVPELICRDDTDYVAKIVALASDTGLRQDLSKRLKLAASALRDHADSQASLNDFFQSLIESR